MAKFWGFTNDSNMVFTPGFGPVIRAGGSNEVVPRLSIDRLIENASFFDAGFAEGFPWESLKAGEFAGGFAEGFAEGLCKVRRRFRGR